jgi:cytochrome c oxidase accessory protein FixG
MSASLKGIAPPGRVLPTLNEDGSRRWIRPKPSPGRFEHRRRITAYVLMLVFFVIPFLRIGGKSIILLDLARREFTLFGTTFQQTETMLFMLLFLSALIAIFFVTAMFGRVWCGWACPQTVYMEYLFRPVERWIEGGWRASQRMDRKRGLHPRRWLKHAVYVVLALFVAHTFLAYFVRPEDLIRWVQGSPADHPLSFFIVMFTTALILFDFAYFREQTCLVACPYGRIQSALLDRRSVIVGYDPGRGEPRVRGMIGRPASAGDCIDCRMCVLTCPTGIDIRDGLQMECIHCTQCIDACDFVMGRIRKPLGLIRYASQDELRGQRTSALRMRVIVYPLMLALTLGGLVYGILTRPSAEVTVLRDQGTPYMIQQDGRVANPLRLRVSHRGTHAGSYTISLVNAPDLQLIAPVNPVTVEPGRMSTAPLFVVAPPAGFQNGDRDVTFRISDGHRFNLEVPYHLVGPRPQAGGAR